MKKWLDPEHLYQQLPVVIQNIAVSVEGWRLEQRRYGKAYRDTFEKIQRQEKLTPEELNRFKKNRLRKFLQTASQSVFWAKRFREYNVDVSTDDLLAEVAKLPVLTKADVKAHVADIFVHESSLQPLVSVHTSGTTGSGLGFKTTQEGEREQWAIWWRYRRWHGITHDTWCGYFGGRSLVPLSQTNPPFWRVNRPGKQIMFSAYHLKTETARDYVDALRHHAIEWIHGYPSTLSLLAGFIVDNNLPKVPSVRVITTGAENLLLQQKKTIASAFEAPVFQHYGQAEAVANISECEHGQLHVDEDFSLVEFVPLDSEGSSYKIIGTNWTNAAFPLIRYDTGDVVTCSTDECPCGRLGRIVKDVDGRREDFIQLPGGALVGRLDHIFKDLVHIREAQIYQKEPASVTFRIVKGAGYDESKTEHRLLDEAVKRLGGEMRIHIEYLSSIEKTGTGKLRFVVSEVSRERKFG